MDRNHPLYVVSVSIVSHVCLSELCGITSEFVKITGCIAAHLHNENGCIITYLGEVMVFENLLLQHVLAPNANNNVLQQYNKTKVNEAIPFTHYVKWIIRVY